MQKRIKKRIVSFVAVLVVALMAASPAFGASRTLSVPFVSQTQSENCCWACAGTAVCKYYGIGITKEQFIFKVRGTTDTSVGGTASDITYGLSCYGLSPAMYSNNYYNYSDLVDDINAGRPVIGSGYWNGQNHAYVYVGYEYLGTLALGGNVIINDSSLGANRKTVFQNVATNNGYYSESYIVAF